uniref:Carboxypeptidase-like regulatory domain-containing protein n=1 Tax=Roseihalotalea indica TaxID=2867963 RepID=A0AA49GHZ7_9BACT|nr:carboxypeptidase-like regulatory domain-containing protein [Tunicatimonas sp. TK19036]
MKYCIGLLFMLCAFSVSAQQQLRGFIQTPLGDAVPYAHVQNFTQQLVATSQPNGFFSVRAVSQDTLRFTAVGFQPYQLIVQPVHFGQELKIILIEDSVLLPGITIYDRPIEPIMKAPERKPMKVNSVRSKEEIVQKKTIRVEMNNPISTENGVPTIGVGGTFTGVLTYLYDQFSKDGKERKKYAETRQQAQEEAVYLELINTPATADSLKAQYQLTQQEYDQLLTSFNEQYPDAKKLSTKSEIWGLLHFYFSQRNP